LKYIGQHDAILVAHEENEYALAAVEKVLSGKLQPTDVLPVTLTPN